MTSASLFTNIASGAAGEELLARNVVGMKITPVSCRRRRLDRVCAYAGRAAS